MCNPICAKHGQSPRAADYRGGAFPHRKRRHRASLPRASKRSGGVRQSLRQLLCSCGRRSLWLRDPEIAVAPSAQRARFLRRQIPPCFFSLQRPKSSAVFFIRSAIFTPNGQRDSQARQPMFCGTTLKDMPMYGRQRRSSRSAPRAKPSRAFPSFSSLLVFWMPVFQVLWISIACLEEAVSTRDY